MAANGDGSAMRFFLQNDKSIECTSSGCTEPVANHDCSTKLSYFGCVYTGCKLVTKDKVYNINFVDIDVKKIGAT